MKNLFFGFLAIIMFSTLTNAQTSTRDWNIMMDTFNKEVNEILIKDCPKELTLEKYRLSLINGENKLSQVSIEEISRLSEPLKVYGREFSEVHNITIENDSDLMFLGTIDPSIPVSGGDLQFSTNGLTGSEILECAAVAIGADLLWSLGASTATSWGAAALTRAFTKVASRFLGPIGVAIAGVSFGVCIVQQAND